MRVIIAQTERALANLENALAFIAQTLAASDGCDLLVLPELALTGFMDAGTVRQRAITSSGLEMARFGELARRYDTALAFGYAELDDEGLHNSAAVIAPDGTLMANARKMHLWGEYERTLFVPGAPSPVISLMGCRLGILICYDLDFPEAALDLVRNGADTLLVLSGTTAPYDVIPDAVVPARAYENGCHLIFANRGGQDGDFTFIGRSCIVGPDGGVVARTESSAAACVTAKVEPERSVAWRRAHTHLSDRRTDLFHLSSRTPWP